jgi:hypothetical protein
MRKTTGFAMLGAVILLLAWLAGCSESTAPERGEAKGQLLLHLVDAPSGFDAVNVVVTQVSVHRSDPDGEGEWVVVHSDTTTYDLLELTNGASAVLADTSLVVGHYTQVRLLLGEGNAVIVDGVERSLRVPSGMTSGLKLNHPFDIREGGLYEATLDFDASRSIHQNGQGDYILQPVIRIAWHVISGSILGIVSPAEANAEVWTVAGDDTVSTFADGATGFFKLVSLPAGIYDVTIASTAGAYADTVIAPVGVVAGQETDLGIIELSAE